MGENPSEVSVLLDEWKALVGWLPQGELALGSWERGYLIVNGAIMAAYVTMLDSNSANVSFVLLVLAILGCMTSLMWYRSMRGHHVYFNERVARLRKIEEEIRILMGSELLLRLGDAEANARQKLPRTNLVRRTFPLALFIAHPAIALAVGVSLAQWSAPALPHDRATAFLVCLNVAAALFGLFGSVLLAFSLNGVISALHLAALTTDTTLTALCTPSAAIPRFIGVDRHLDRGFQSARIRTTLGIAMLAAAFVTQLLAIGWAALAGGSPTN